MIKISIITPVYNASDHINDYLRNNLERFKSLHSIFEYIFIDDCSKDDSFLILNNKVSNLNNCEIIRNNINIGPGCSRLEGVKKAKGKFLLFLDIDDKVDLNEKYKNQYKVMLETKNDWSFTQFSINGVKQLPDFLKINHLDQILRHRYISMSSVMIKKSLFIKYQELMCFSSYSCEDYIVWIALALDNIFPLYISKTNMIYNKCNNTLSANKFRQAFNVFLIYKKLLGLRKGFLNFIFYVLNKL